MTTTKKTTTPSTTTPAVVPATPAQPAAPAAPPQTPQPDPNVALAALVQQAVAQLVAIQSSLGDDPTLTATQKRHAVRMRKGGEPVLATIANLATQYGLESPTMQTVPMLQQAGKASALLPLVNGLVTLSQRVNDLVFAAQSSAWDGGIKFYTLLHRLAPSNTLLAAALQPVTQFFAYRHPTIKAAGAQTKPQKKATKKAVATLKNTAPQLLAPQTPAQAPTAAPATPSPAAPKAS